MKGGYMPKKYYTLADNYMFQTVMADEDRLKELLRRILPELHIENLEVVMNEKSMDYGKDHHGIRLDIYARDGKRLYDVEMQTRVSKKDLYKRADYYHNLLKTNNFEKGKNYSEMKDSYVIFICNFDPFKDQRYQYTIKSVCQETKKVIPDGRTTIFLNSKGRNGDISQELKEFLSLVEGDVVNTKDSYILSIKEAVDKVNEDSEWRNGYMTLDAVIYDAEIKAEKRGLRKGKKEGREEGILLGEEKGRDEGIYNAYTMLKKLGYSDKDCLKAIANQYDMPVSKVKEIIKKNK